MIWELECREKKMRRKNPGWFGIEYTTVVVVLLFWANFRQWNDKSPQSTDQNIRGAKKTLMEWVALMHLSTPHLYIYPWLYPFAGGHDGVGWGGADDVPGTWTHLWCYGDDNVPCAWTHLWCYGDDDVPCTWKHLWCYGEVGGLGWGGVGWGWWRSLHMNTSLMLRRWWRPLHMNTSLMLQKNSSSRCCSIAQKAWHNVSAECFAVVQKWL